MNFYEDFLIKKHATGSSYICSPPVLNTDIDTVILSKPNYSQFLMNLGWLPHSGEGYEVMGGDFVSWRKGNKNYIVTTDSHWYESFVKATRICKMMNLLNKVDRVFMFKMVMHGDGLPSVIAEPFSYPPGEVVSEAQTVNPAAEQVLPPPVPTVMPSVDWFTEAITTQAPFSVDQPNFGEPYEADF